MNILFMTIAYPKAGERNIYVDLMQEFKRNGHKVYIACSNEKRNRQLTKVHIEDEMNVLRIRTGNLTGDVKLIEKGISTIFLEYTFIKGISKFFANIKFDLIIYSTPPITFAKVVLYLKKRDHAITYLLLKDIFPQNAVDIDLIKSNSLLFEYFRCKEKKLYKLTDYIGCMSQANVDFIKKHNKSLNINSIEVCPNSIAPSQIIHDDKASIKSKYGIPNDSITFIYGGNLGKPQGIDFVVECLQKNSNKSDRFFIICGKGTDYYRLETFYNEVMPNNILLINGLPKKEYDDLVFSCDIGLLFLDYRFTIPNFPSRLLSYMENSMPVVACTDPNTDIGKIITEGGFGWWCESNNSDEFTKVIDKICSSKYDLCDYGKMARKYLEDNYTVKISYDIIMRHF